MYAPIQKKAISLNLQYLISRPAFFALIIPLLFRAFYEIYSLPYTIGYDSVAYYIPILTGQSSIISHPEYEISPLYFIIANSIQFILQNPLLTTKILAIVLSGLFGLSLCLWGSTFLSQKNALFLSLISFFYFSTLRITWDLQRNVLGLTLLLFALFALESIKNKKIRLILPPFLAVLAIIANPLIAPLLFFMLLPKIMKRDKIASFTTLIPLVIAGLALYFVIGMQTTIVNLIMDQFVMFNQYVFQSAFPLGSIDLEFSLYLMLPLLPFLFVAIVSMSKDKIGINKILPAILWFVSSLILSSIIVWGYRIALMAPIPAIAIIIYYFGEKHRTQRKMLIGVTLILAVGFCALQYPYTFPYYTTPVMWRPQFLFGIPNSMLQNTVPLADSSKVNDLFLKANALMDSSNKSSILLVNEPMVFFSITSHSNNTYYYGSQFTDPKPTINNYLMKGYNVYIVWWQSGKQWYNLDFAQVLSSYNYSIVAIEGDYAIYHVFPPS